MSYNATPGTGSLVAIENQRKMRTVPSGKSPVYAIDFSAVACGARIASTKRKIRWRFGFTNIEALDAGLTGQECRGEEHDISLVWSIASGKRVVHVDQQEVHYSNSRNSTFEFSWTMRGNHVLKIVAHASPPISATPGFRQYDFFVDGLSFFSFPKVYRLNILGKEAPGHYPTSTTLSVAERYTRRSESNQPDWKLEEPQNEQEEEAILKEILEESIKEADKEKEKIRKENEKKVNATNNASKSTSDDLLDFFSDLPASSNQTNQQQNYPSQTQPSTVTNGNPWNQPTKPSANNASNTYGFAQPTAPSIYSQPVQNPAPTPAAYAVPAPFASPTTGVASYPAPAPTATQVAQATYAPVAAPYTQAQTYPAQSSAAQNVITPVPAPAPAPAPAPTPISNPTPAPSNTNISKSVETSKQPTSVANKNNLNLKVGDTLADQAYMKIANDFNLLSTNDQTENVRSNPFDTPSSYTAPQPTLEGLKTSKPEIERKEVMKVNPGSLVVTGNQNQQGNWGGYGNQFPSTNGQGYNYANQGAMNTNMYNMGTMSQPNAHAGYPSTNAYAAYPSQSQPQYNMQQPATNPNQQTQYQQPPYGTQQQY